jgi:hypothetical protein
MPIAYALRVMIQLSAALEFAHKYTVHRDLKPENVMITAQGQVKLMDFGISKLKSDVQFTSAQMVMGTPKYMSPEQLKDSSKVDHRTDIYALGAMLYELLTGDVPTGLARQPSQIRAETPPALDDVVSKCLALDPKDRYQSAGELRRELQQLLDAVEKSTGIEIPDFEVAAVPPVSRSFPLKKVLGTAAVVLVLVLAGVGVWRLERIQAGEEEANAGETSQLAVTPVDPFAVAFEDLGTRVKRARRLGEDMAAREKARHAAAEAEGEIHEAENGGLARENVETRAIHASYVEEGDAFWKNAEELAAQRHPDAFRAAWHALECYLGPSICPGGMAFIPPGETVVDQDSDPVIVDGFFMDRYEVTGEEFLSFALDPSNNWHVPDYLASPNVDKSLLGLPVVGVTFYDALAYASRTAPASWAKCTLPTEAQWARAAYADARPPVPYPWGTEWDPTALSAAGEADGYSGPAPVGSFESDCSPFGCYDVAGNAMEWTCSMFARGSAPSRADVNPAEIWFGSDLAVRGGSYEHSEVPLTARRSAGFDETGAQLGFRCALSFPGDLETIDGFLR